MSGTDSEEEGTQLDNNKKSLKIYNFNRANLPSLLSKAKKLLAEPKTKVQLYARSERAHRLATKQKCTVNSLKFASSETNSLKPQLGPYILLQFRRCLLKHNWAAAKRLLLIFFKYNTHHRVSWTSCLTSLIHFPGAQHVLKEFIELNKGNYNSNDLLSGLLTINGLEAYRPTRLEEEDDEEEEDSDLNETSDSEDVDEVEVVQLLTDQDDDSDGEIEEIDYL